MNYEKKYKEALERARQFSEHPLQEDSADIVEYIFPELAESEDERIRKWLIDWAKAVNWSNQFSVTQEQVLAWIEKQGNFKMVDSNKVIEWLNHRELSYDDVVSIIIPDDSPTSIPRRVKWLSDEFIKKFKKDFGL